MMIQTLLISLFTWAGHSADYLPKGDCDQKVNYQYYSICYSDYHRQAKWTIHELSPESVNGKQKRTNNFRSDPQVDDPVDANALSGSGFDRGHLVPAGDMKLNYASMSETFFMTNISPQRPSFNRGLWRVLEERVRYWVKREGKAFVVTAPYLEQSMAQTDKDITIPDWYYKIVYIPEKDEMRAFWMPNENLKGHSIEEYAVSVNDIEEWTGLDFFSELPDAQEERLESQVYEP
ncbi:MAG: DNA/RNA non-specific endonuclease [Bdellovibrionales bacterium]|nr:DNA/RNA non-specific endonuclease [Bdellovibrionales bacterium]